MYLIVNKYLIPKGFSGLTIFPFILVKNQKDKDNLLVLNHEKIHLRQQIELLILLFFCWYLIEFCIRLVQYKNWDLAYRNISFEREAYANEYNAVYLQKRPVFKFLNYLSLKNHIF